MTDPMKKTARHVPRDAFEKETSAAAEEYSLARERAEQQGREGLLCSTAKRWAGNGLEERKDTTKRTSE